MAQLAAFWAKLTILVSTMRFSDIVDILIVAYLIYNIIMLIRKTNSFRLARGILLILIALWLSGVLKLTMFNRLLQKTVELGLIALVIIFQPELRRLLERMGSKTFPSFGSKPLETLGMDNVISQTIAACTQLSSTKTGALKNIFYPKAPLHDGAVVIRDGRIAAAGCVLPLTSNTNLSPDLGTRHRAGIGMSEHSDAVVVIVSEETGGISISVDGMLKRRLSAETFEAILRSELLPAEEQRRRRWDVFVDFVKKLNPLRRENRYDKKDDNQQNHQQ